MIRRTSIGLVSALLALSLAPAARAGTVSGRVLDSGGAPVAGARVSWEEYRTDDQVLVDETKGAVPAWLGETTTDASGHFQVKLDKPGVDVSIRVMPGTLPGTLLAGPYDSSEDVALDDIELPAVEKISGRVSDETGKAVSDARIRMTTGLGFEEGDVVFYAEGKSGADGSYSIPNAPVNGGGLSVRAAGYSPSRQPSLQRRTTVNVTLKRGGTIRAVVSDPNGKPAEGATVIVGSLAAKTDASGACELAGVPTGTQQVEAFWKEDLAARRDSLHVKKGDAVDVTLRLAKAASVTGSVVDERTRRPIAGVRVSASAGSLFSLGELRSRRARTDAKGRFRIAGLAARSYTVRASKIDYLPAILPGVLAGTSTPGSVAIALQKAAAVSGRVSDESGAPVSGARVRFARDSNIRTLMRGGPAAFLGRPGVTSGPDGTFRMRGLAAEKNLTLEAAKAGYVTAKRHGVTLKPGETVKDLALILKRGLEARGKVVDSTGQAIPGAEIRVTPVERGGARFVAQFAGVNREKADATSGPDGSFRLAGLEAGDYALGVSRDGYAPKRVPSATVVEKGPNDWPPIVLAAGVPIAGVVRNSKGDPIIGAEVFAFGEGITRNSRTDPEGRFRLEGYGADRRVMINVRAEGYAALQRSVTPSAEEVALVLTTSGTIRGRVEDGATNRPLTDFTASYTDGGGRLIGGIRVVMGVGDREKTFQSSDGTFELSDVPPGKWNVRASSPGYRPAEVSGIELAEGETKEGVVVALKKGGIVSGKVLDPRRGTGVPNASVSWSEGSDASASSPGMLVLSRLDAGGGRAVTTDADGRFRFDGLPPGKITLSAEHPDFLDVSKQVDLDEEATVDLTFALGGSISGTVVGKDGRSGIPGAEVFLRDQGAAYSIGDDSARADASGNFSFEHLKAGRYGVSARSNAGATEWKDLVLTESQRQEGVLLEITTGATVQGTVSGLPGRSVGGVRIFASTKDYQDSAVTGDDGRFTLRDVPSGVLRLQASTAFPSMRSTSKNLDVPEGATEVPVEIVFEGASRLSGRVTRGDKPVSNAFVSAMPDPPTPTGGRVSSQTDEDGRYSIEGLVDGNYLVRVSGQSASYSRSFTVSGDTNGDIALPTLTISGVVTEAGSNEPIEGAFIQAESGQERTGVPAQYTQTDSRGFYSLDGVDSGNYQITARKEGYQLKTLPVSVGAAPAELNVSLTRGAGLSIRAVDGLTGIPLRSLTVLAYTGSGSLAFTGDVGLDGEGKGEISSLSPGGYSLFIFSEGFASRSHRVTVPSPMVSIAMTPGGRVEVRTDAPFTGRIVDAVGAPYMIFPGRLDARVTGAPPAVSWGGFAPGSYRLIVSGSSGESSFPFTVSEGQTTTVQIR